LAALTELITEGFFHALCWVGLWSFSFLLFSTWRHKYSRRVHQSPNLWCHV